MTNPADMTDEELEQAELAISGAASESTESTDETDDTGEAAETGKTTDGTVTTESTESTSTTTEQTGQAGETTTVTPDPKAEAQTSAVAETGKVAGVASKDGTRVLPYSALQAERRSHRQAAARADRAEADIERLKGEIEDLRAGKSRDTGEVSEEEVQRMEADFPEVGAKMRAVFERNQELAKQVAAAKPKETPPEEVTDDPVQEIIDQVPLLVEWQHDAKHKDLWERSIEHDALLMKSPKWKDKPAVERFTEAARRTAEEFDIEVPGKTPAATASSSTAKPSPDPKKVIEQATRAAPSTLSDLKGGAVPDHGQTDFKKMGPSALLNRFMDMDPAEIDRQLEKLG